MFSKQRYIIILLSFWSHAMVGSGMFNWLRPYDTLVRPEFAYNWYGVRFGLYAEGGLTEARGYNRCGQEVNVLEIWNENQNAIAMLMGFDPNSPISKKLAEIDVPNDDGLRGHFDFRGSYKLRGAVALSAHYYFWEYLALAFYLPAYSMSLDVWRKELTRDDGNPATLRVREDLTNNFDQNVALLGDGLSLSGWRKTGPGDLVIMVEGVKDFPQMRPMLKNVRVNGRFGLNVPTGVRQDEDKIFFPPFGYDGSLGIVAGGGLTLTLVFNINAGFDIELLPLFGNVRERRIKTHADQTELLLLEKTPAFKDFGLNQRINLFFEVYNLIDTLNVKVGYQFFKENQSKLAFCSCDFSSNIANKARSLDESIMHHIVVNAYYDFANYWCPPDSYYKPYISLYARLPFKGTNIALIPTLGAVVSVKF